MVKSIIPSTAQLWPHFYGLSIFAIVITGIISRMLFNRYARPLYKYPGPFLASCTRFWLGKAAVAYTKGSMALRRYLNILTIGP